MLASLVLSADQSEFVATGDDLSCSREQGARWTVPSCEQRLDLRRSGPVQSGAAQCPCELLGRLREIVAAEQGIGRRSTGGSGLPQFRDKRCGGVVQDR